MKAPRSHPHRHRSILLLRNSSGRRKQEKETRRVPDKEDAFTAATKEETKRAAVKRLRPLTSSSLISTKEKEVKVLQRFRRLLSTRTHLLPLLYKRRSWEKCEDVWNEVTASDQMIIPKDHFQLTDHMIAKEKKLVRGLE